jgi:hypothetical protein
MTQFILNNKVINVFQSFFVARSQYDEQQQASSYGNDIQFSYFYHFRPLEFDYK